MSPQPPPSRGLGVGGGCAGSEVGKVPPRGHLPQGLCYSPKGSGSRIWGHLMQKCWAIQSHITLKWCSWGNTNTKMAIRQYNGNCRYRVVCASRFRALGAYPYHSEVCLRYPMLIKKESRTIMLVINSASALHRNWLVRGT